MEKVIRPADSEDRDCLLCGKPSVLVLTFNGCPTCGTEVTLCESCLDSFSEELNERRNGA